MAMGERTPLAVINAPASGRMAIGEALTNLAAAPVGSIADVKDLRDPPTAAIRRPGHPPAPPRPSRGSWLRVRDRDAPLVSGSACGPPG